MPNDAKQWSQGTDFYIRTKQPWYFFSCIPKGFWSPAFDFNIGVPIKQSHSYTLTSAILKFDVCEATMMSTPNVLAAELRDLLYNQCIGNTCWSSIFIYPTGRIRVCKIRFVWQHWWKSQKNLSGVQEMSINVSAVMYLDWHTVCQLIYDILYIAMKILYVDHLLCLIRAVKCDCTWNSAKCSEIIPHHCDIVNLIRL